MLQAGKEGNILSKTKTTYPNRLLYYRQRFGFTQEQLALLAGFKNKREIRRIESGSTLPGILKTIRLSAALRVPIEYLYEDTYKRLREEVRFAEEHMPKGRQGVLPLPQ